MNFDYLKETNFEKLYELCTNCENLVFSAPNLSITSARKAIEYVIKFMYPVYLKIIPNDMTLFDMINDSRFKDFLDDDQILGSIHYIRKMGNIAVHNDTLNEQDAICVLDELHFVISELCILFEVIDDYDEFVSPVKCSGNVKEAEKIVKEKVEVEDEIIAEFASKLRQTKFNVKHKRDELENKKLFLEASLREANWPIVNKANVALPKSVAVNLMLDNNNKEDYVFCGRDNKPLAIVNFKETSANLLEGRKKAIEKAKIIETKYGYRPVIYYTNGYIIYCIDGLGYPPRRVFDFHTLEELELLKLRQTMRLDILNPTIDDNITNRYYQKEAINAVCRAFSSLRRKSLLVMATGTGKTRVAISVVDVLMKARWVKNVLFLADRISLVKQAHKNFNKLLPNVPTSIYVGGTDRDKNAHIIFSTYQTMDSLMNDDTKEFSVGRFDLIIVDEAHRSIFKKYKSLFSYFDALMLGLTATPRSEENKSTYDVFELPENEPDYAYELKQAIVDDYLVGYDVIKSKTKYTTDEVDYEDLPMEVRKNIEAVELDDDIDIEQYRHLIMQNYAVINLSTIDIMLNQLMTKGLKVEGGDKLGKTIIFASSHQHAVQIVARFNQIYKELGENFCMLVDSQTEDSQQTIERFEIRDSMPQICVSVDMLDTGIDVPDILNLVFFKTVLSKIKFLQMVGRGTRLSKDIFGAEMDKEGFLIFDYFDNFERFSVETQFKTSHFFSQSHIIYQRKLNILVQLQNEKNLNNFEKDYLQELKTFFINTLNDLNNDNLTVSLNMAFVNKYRTKENWENIDDVIKEEIERKIIPILPSISDNMKVKSFDQIMFFIEEKFKENIHNLWELRIGLKLVCDLISRRMIQLLNLKSIPAIVNKKEMLKSMLNADYIFKNPSFEILEKVRKELRGLMVYLPEAREYYVVDVDDEVIHVDSDQTKHRVSYSKRVSEYLKSCDNGIITKIATLEELTKDEINYIEDTFNNKIGTKDECIAWCNSLPLLQRIRQEVGILDSAIQIKFGNFLNLNVLTKQQLTFMEQIINYAKINGDIQYGTLQQVSPFCDIDISNLFATNINYLKDLILGIHNPIKKL